MSSFSRRACVIVGLFVIGLFFYVFILPHGGDTIYGATKGRVKTAIMGAWIYYNSHEVFPTSISQIVESDFGPEYADGKRNWPKWITSDKQVLDEWGRPLQLLLRDDGKTIRIYTLGRNGVDEGGVYGHDTNGVFRDDWSLEETTACIATKERIRTVMKLAFDYRNKYRSPPTNIVQIVESPVAKPIYEQHPDWINSESQILDAWGKPLRLQLFNDTQSIMISSVGPDGAEHNGGVGTWGGCDLTNTDLLQFNSPRSWR